MVFHTQGLARGRGELDQEDWRSSRASATWARSHARREAFKALAYFALYDIIHVKIFLTYMLTNLRNNIFCRDECLPQYNCVITATNEREVIDISPYFPLVREKYFIVPELLIPRFV